MDTSKWDILGIGVVAVDDLYYVDHYPAPDTKMPAQVERRQGGGLTATAMVAAARLGARSAFCNVMGDDELSRFSIDELEREGVDCSPVLIRPGTRPHHSVVIVDATNGHRTIIYSSEGVVLPSPDDITEALISQCRLLFMDHLVAGLAGKAIDIAHSLNIPVVADIETAAEPAVRTMMRGVDHLIVSLELAQQVTGESSPEAALEALKDAQQQCVAITDGARGSWYAVAGGPTFHQPAFKVKVVDTTGCGDVFHGAYAASIAMGEDVPTAIRFASAAAALKARLPGGRAGIPRRAEVVEFLSQNRG